MTMVINGDGSITGLSAGGLPDATVTQSDLARGVAGTGPAFSAYQSSAQTLSSTTFTKLLFQTEEFDTNNNFASSTFTPTVAGYYQVSGAFGIGASITGLLLAVYKNGSVYKYIQYPYGSSTSAAGGSCVVYCNGTTDFVELYGYMASGQALDARAQSTYFQAVMVRGV